MTLKTGAELQAAINNAQPGDTIIVEAGTVYAHDFILPAKAGTGFVTIQSSRASELPEGKRVSPSQSALFAKLQSVSLAEPPIRTDPGAHHYRFIGLEISPPNPTHVTYDIFRIGDDRQTTLDAVPHDIVIDRCWLHGFPEQDLQRGIALNGAAVTITNNYISDIHGNGYDTQGICCWNGPGPFKIINNHIEGAGENVMFGGAWAAIPGLIPTDIEFRGNYCLKPLSWYANDPSYAGIHWTVKNLFELKNARRVVIDGNVFDGNWTDAQAGRAIAFTPRPSDSGTWAVIEDVQFTNNIIKNIGSGVILLGADEPPAPTETRLRRVRVANNLWYIDGPRFGSNGTFATVINKTEDVVIEHNTAIQTSHVVMADYAPNTRFTFRDNIARHNEYGIFGSGVGIGNPAISHYFADSVITANVLAKEVDAPSNVESIYPAGNYFPESLSAIGFVDLAGGNFKLGASSPYKGKATNGSDPGCDVDVLNAALGGAVVTPMPVPQPTEPIPTQPAPTPTTPTPVPSGTPSPDGTKGTTVVDSDGVTWTIGSNKETLRDGKQADGGQGTVYKIADKTVHVLGMDSNWYRWSGSSWSSVGPAEPGGAVTQPEPTPTQPAPTPTPTPAPSPTEPAVGTLKPKVPWGRTDAKRKQQAKEQRALGYYWFGDETGDFATFIYTGVKLP